MHGVPTKLFKLAPHLGAGAMAAVGVGGNASARSAGEI